MHQSVGRDSSPVLIEWFWTDLETHPTNSCRNDLRYCFAKCASKPETNCPRLITRPIPAARAASSFAVCTCGPKAMERATSSGEADATNSFGSLQKAFRSRQTMLPTDVAFSIAACSELADANVNPQASAAPPTELISIRSVEHRTTESRAGNTFWDMIGGQRKGSKAHPQSFGYCGFRIGANLMRCRYGI